MNILKRKNVARMLIIGLVSVLVCGVVALIDNKFKSNANEINQNSIQEDTGAQGVSEALDEVKEIKKEYQYEETIDNIDELKNALKINSSNSEENYKQIIAQTKEQVLIDYLIEESYNSMKNMDEISTEINNVILSDEISEDVKYTAYDNGDFEVEKSVTNEFGTISTVKIKDEKSIETKAWHKRKEIAGKSENIGYEQRACTYTYEHNMLGLPCFKQTVSFKLKYKSSKDGLKALEIVDNGTKCSLWWSKLKISSKNIIDGVATHTGANLDGYVIAHFSVLQAGKIGDIDIPGAFSYNIKVNFWLTLKEWNTSKKSMKVKNGGTVYVDSASVLTE